MAETISQYQIAPFTTPQNGQPGDADQVRGNDNTVGTGHNSHDADSGVHFQSSIAANRPAAGTAGRKWFTSDTKRLYYDTGSAWVEADYAPNATLASYLTTAIAASTYLTQSNAISTYLPLTGGSLSGNLNANGGITAGLIQTPNDLDLWSSSANGVVVQTGAGQTSRWRFENAGQFNPAVTNTYDIGDATHKVHTIWLGTSVIVGTNQVLGPRDTGWTAMTGTTNKATAYDTATVTLAQLAGRVMALQAALTTHGTIGA